MINVPITLKKSVTLTNVLEPVSVSVPFQNGQLFDVNTLILTNEDKDVITSQIDVIGYWPNKSIKWMRIHFLYSCDEETQPKVYLTQKEYLSEYDDSQSSTKLSQIKVTDNNTHLEIATGNALFSLSKLHFGIFSANAIYDKEGKPNFISDDNSLVLFDKNNQQYLPVINNIECNNGASFTTKSVQLTVNISGHFVLNERTTGINFSAEVTFYVNQVATKWQFTLHNSKSMVHSGGTWDLGNQNSVFFKSLEIIVPCESELQCEFKLSAEESLWQKNTGDFSLFQASSGGKNWQSQNHINHLGKVELGFQGYRLLTDNSDDIIVGRASPSLHVSSAEQNSSGLSVHIKDFWQKFPKALSLNDDNVVLGLFPKEALGGFELQPGEKKSDVFHINYGASKHCLDAIENSITATVSADYLASSQALPFFCEKNQENEYNTIINDGLTSENNFFNKRELIDEFGWRNFGDLYADHETLECDHQGELISHYNNQYDPLYGFLRQYLLTNDERWLALANDLADHVVNIDIYHTNADKAEYNGGLFWHTDHYLPAETASHRTYSSLQKNDAYQDHAGGGGPGGQHCYTTGLMLHYFITGQESSKQAVLQLSQWITHVYEGSGTLTDFLLAIKNKNRLDVKNVFSGKYPLDRGTGHYIIALIDAFELTGKQSYLDQASLIIKHTVHPDDDIVQRALTNVEECWFYTVFLQAVYRYLLVKESSEQLDRSFHYAKASLLHYAKWMCENEQPYLNKPDILEYPNHTWAAQDIRKANVLFMASYFAESIELKVQCKSKADEIYHYVINAFELEPTRSFTRILSILMQNHGVKSFVEQNLGASTSETFAVDSATQINNEKNKNLLDAFITTLSNTSLSNELAWLRKRSKSVDDFFAKIGK